MKVEIISNSDENFKILSKQFGEVYVATDGTHSVIAATEQEAIKSVQEMQAQPPITRGKPVPLENPKSNRMGFFDGTSWDDGKRGHQFD